MPVSRVETSPWAASRSRAEVLRKRHEFAAEQLTLYLALLEAWDDAWRDADGVEPETLAGWAARRVLPRVIAVTKEAGPAPLADALPATVDPMSGTRLMAAWLAGAEPVAVERYLARVTLRGPLAAVDPNAACAADPAPRGGRRCPSCGGPPQLSFRAASHDRLSSGTRKLSCARCGTTWNYSASACACCGEDRGARRTIYAERREGPKVGRAENGATGTALFGHLRVETCASCSRFLVDVDLGHDPLAVPEVDELVALPLSMHAAEHGFTKITPNVLGL